MATRFKNQSSVTRDVCSSPGVTQQMHVHMLFSAMILCLLEWKFDSEQDSEAGLSAGTDLCVCLVITGQQRWEEKTPQNTQLYVVGYFAERFSTGD